MSITVDVDGADAIVAGLGTLIKQTESKTNAAIQRAGINTMTRARQRVRVRTGYTQQHISYEAGDLEATVKSEGPAVPWLEMGTRKMRAYPYFYPSFNEASRELESDLQDIF